MEVAPVLVWTEWLADVRRLRTASIDAYSRTLTAFAAHMPDSEWAAVTATDIEQFMGRPRARGCDEGSPATQDRDRIAISNFFQWLQARGYLTVNVTRDVGVPKVRNRAPRAVPDGVWRQLWQSPMPPDDRVWLGLGCFAGLRRREIVSLSPQQVDSTRGMFLGMERKGGSEEAVEYEQMARVIADHLPSLLPDPDEWLGLVAEAAAYRRHERCLITMDAPTTETTRMRMSFTDVLLPDPGVINRRLTALLRAANLPGGAITPHALRHTCATNLLRSGVPIEVVSDALGHTSIDTTRRYVKSAGRLAEWRGSRQA